MWQRHTPWPGGLHVSDTAHWDGVFRWLGSWHAPPSCNSSHGLASLDYDLLRHTTGEGTLLPPPPPPSAGWGVVGYRVCRWTLETHLGSARYLFPLSCWHACGRHCALVVSAHVPLSALPLCHVTLMSCQTLPCVSAAVGMPRPAAAGGVPVAHGRGPGGTCDVTCGTCSGGITAASHHFTALKTMQPTPSKKSTKMCTINT